MGVPDRRVRRTQKQLQAALLWLIERKEFSEITVEEITERADVGRTTFYLHYSDKGKLLAACVTFLAEDTRVQSDPVLHVFKNAQANSALWMTVLSGKGGVEALEQTYRDVSRLAGEVFELQIHAHDLKPVIMTEVMAYHFAGALISLVYWWLKEGLAQYTAEQMTDQFYKLNMLGRTYGLGLDPTDTELLRSLGNFADYAGRGKRKEMVG